MSTEHLKSGSPLPPFTGKLRVYSMRFCPYAQRTILVLNAKKIPYEVVNLNLKDKPEWLTSKSPLGKVPALEVEENVVIYESLVTAEYVDDKYPTPKLVSSDPLRKAQDKLIVENYGKITAAYYKCLMNKTGGEAEQNEIDGGFQSLETEMKNRGTKFLGGNTPGMVDYMIWPWFERLELVSVFTDNKVVVDYNKFSTLKKWVDNMMQDPAVQSHYLEKNIHKKFFDGFLAGKPDYEILNKQ